MKGLEKGCFRLLIVCAVLIWSVLAMIVYQDYWHKPLGPELDIPIQDSPTLKSSEMYPTVTLFSTAIAAVETITSQVNIPSPTLRKPLCGGPDQMTILAIGSDTRANTYLYGLADVIRFVRIDFATPRVTVLEFPRDLWVEIPDIKDHYGTTHGKLNQAYFYGNPGMGYYQGPGQGPGLLARTLNLNFGALPDHYIAINMQTFVRVVDAVGGIDISLPFSVDARKADQKDRKDLYFQAGFHHLNGTQALMLGRIREYSVFARADQQNRILCSLKNTFISPYFLPKLPAVIDSFSGAVQTDLSPEQISQLACLMPQIKPGNISFTTFPRELLTEARTYDIGVKKEVYIFKADFEILKSFVERFNLGLWPPAEQSSSTYETPRPRGEGLFNCP